MNYGYGDFKKYYDKTLKRNIWVLGYTGGSINISDVMRIAIDYAEMNKVPLQTVVVDEILKSTRFQNFKFVYSTQKQNEIDPEVKIGDRMQNVYEWLRS